MPRPAQWSSTARPEAGACSSWRRKDDMARRLRITGAGRAVSAGSKLWSWDGDRLPGNAPPVQGAEQRLEPLGVFEEDGEVGQALSSGSPRRWRGPALIAPCEGPRKGRRLGSPGDPAPGRVVPEHPLALRAGHDVEVVEVVAVRASPGGSRAAPAPRRHPRRRRSHPGCGRRYRRAERRSPGGGFRRW